MSHIHIPDGVLPWWLIVAGWVLTFALLAASSNLLKRQDLSRRLPLMGVMSALMLVGMTLEIVPIGYHVNLTVISGIVLGPAMGFIAAFIVDLILAMIGHGGITVVGLNTLVIGAEIALGYYAFKAFARILRGRAGLSAAAAVVLSLLLATLLTIGIVGIASINPGEQAPHAAALSFGNPFGEGVLALELAGEEGHEAPQMDLLTFAKIVLGLGAIGWAIEAAMTGLLARYVVRVRPDLLRIVRSGS